MIHTEPIEMLPLAKSIVVPNGNFLTLLLVVNLYLILVSSSRIEIHHFILGEELPSLKSKLLWISVWVFVHAFLNHPGQNRIINRCASHLDDFFSPFVDLGVGNEIST